MRDEAEGRRLLALSLAAIGVVYGDIGTSPIYAFRESFHTSHGIEPVSANILGVLSLIFWSLIIVISVKYLGLVMRADNRGEGGIVALTALVMPPDTRVTDEEPVVRIQRSRRWLLGMVGLFGAALLYGDSMITPAISVLSAIEGLEVATPVFRPFVIPVTIGILLALFFFQKRGTEGLGAVFGPVTLVWFISLAALGVAQLIHNPAVIKALSPHYGFAFFIHNGLRGFLVLGSVFLVVTGGEALYADMGHFGKRPIRLMWFSVVLPCLLLNYFGQGAMLLRRPEAVEQPFFLMAPAWALYPLVAIATAATVIASQAVISGAFSLTRQAVQLGYLPRLKILHTSSKQIGQIYLPAVNLALMIACIGLVLGFRTSGNLAAAYGVAVTTDMVFTTILFAAVARMRWRWGLWATGLLTFALLLVDLSYWFANLPKIPHGGWFPLAVAGTVFVAMTTWKRGRRILAARYRELVIPMDDFLLKVAAEDPLRVPGTAVYMNSFPYGTPPALHNNLKHNKVLHERVVMLCLLPGERPVVVGDRCDVSDYGQGIYQITASYGFTEDPDVPALLAGRDLGGQLLDLEETTFFLGRETLVPTRRPGGMSIWRERLFAWMTRSAQRAASYFQIPSDRVIEIGSQIDF
ncbi:MAG: potassium transporter Kup [Gemmatimonadales bacterium]